MKVEMIRSRIYKGQTLERGRVVDVDDTFGRWLISKGMAAAYVRPTMIEAPKRERPAKGA
jgi:hypothetical protein